MTCTYAGLACLDPAQEQADCRARGYPAPWAGVCNSFVCPQGQDFGRGRVLMFRGDLLGLNLNQFYPLTFYDGTRIVTLKRLLFVRAYAATPGSRGDPSEACWCELADARYLAHQPIDRAYNVRSAPGGAYYSATQNSGSPWTWAGMAGDIWGAVGRLGPFPGLPFNPDGVPEGWTFWAGDAFTALGAVLNRLGCALDYNPITDVFSVIRLGVPDAAGAAALAAADPSRVWDVDPLEGVAARVPGKVRVYFGKQAATVDATGGSPFYALDQADPTPGGPLPGTDQTNVAVVYDDLPAIYDGTGALTNGPALASRALERVGDFYRRVRQTRLYRSYSGGFGAAGLLAGSQLTATLWRDAGGGLFTEVVRLPGVPGGDPFAGMAGSGGGGTDQGGSTLTAGGPGPADGSTLTAGGPGPADGSTLTTGGGLPAGGPDGGPTLAGGFGPPAGGGGFTLQGGFLPGFPGGGGGGGGELVGGPGFQGGGGGFGVLLGGFPGGLGGALLGGIPIGWPFGPGLGGALLSGINGALLGAAFGFGGGGGGAANVTVQNLDGTQQTNPLSVFDVDSGATSLLKWTDLGGGVGVLRWVGLTVQANGAAVGTEPTLDVEAGVVGNITITGSDDPTSHRTTLTINGLATTNVNGAHVGTEPATDFIAGTGITIVGADHPGLSVGVTISIKPQDTSGGTGLGQSGAATGTTADAMAVAADLNNSPGMFGSLCLKNTGNSNGLNYQVTVTDRFGNVAAGPLVSNLGPNTQKSLDFFVAGYNSAVFFPYTRFMLQVQSAVLGHPTTWDARWDWCKCG